MNLAPVVLFVYNRLAHTRLTVEALQKNILANQSDLIIFSDAPKVEEQYEAVRKIRKYIHQIDGFKSVSIVERPNNFGLANSIIDGVTTVVNQHGRVIVLEDDLVTSPFFLQYMNDALNLYSMDDNVASIHGYVYPIDGLPETFFMRGADCWGWATWKDKWGMFEPDGVKLLSELTTRKLTKRFDLNGGYAFTQMLVDQIAGVNNSWAIRWHASAFLNNKFTLYPTRSLVLNIGVDGSGEHCGVSDAFNTDVMMTPVNVQPIAVNENESSFKSFEIFFKKQTSFLGKIKKNLIYLYKIIRNRFE